MVTYQVSFKKKTLSEEMEMILKSSFYLFFSEIPVATFDGHAQRVSDVAFHPSGRYIGTARYFYLS